jgi:hypothetical protein
MASVQGGSGSPDVMANVLAEPPNPQSDCIKLSVSRYTCNFPWCLSQVLASFRVGPRIFLLVCRRLWSVSMAAQDSPYCLFQAMAMAMLGLGLPPSPCTRLRPESMPSPVSTRLWPVSMSGPGYPLLSVPGYSQCLCWARDSPHCPG